MTCEEDKLISEVLGEAPAEDCPDASPDEASSGSPSVDIESVADSSR